MGHALNNTLQDILIRCKRMDGFNALWHAGHRPRRHRHPGRGRAAARRRGQDARKTSGARPSSRASGSGRRSRAAPSSASSSGSGASCDWARERFTMDAGPLAAVREVFVRLWEEGLIYRATTSSTGARAARPCCRTSRWSARSGTPSSSTSSTARSRSAPCGRRRSSATPRWRSIPKDKRYTQVRGQDARGAVGGGQRSRCRWSPTSAVDPKFGTGVIKVTPGHDPVDFEIGRRHDLPIRTRHRLRRQDDGAGRASTPGSTDSRPGSASSRTCRRSGSSSASSPTATRSASAIAARRWWSRSSPSSGTCA